MNRTIKTCTIFTSRWAKTTSTSTLRRLSSFTSVIVTKNPQTLRSSCSFQPTKCCSLTVSSAITIPTRTITLSTKRSTSQFLKRTSESTPFSSCGDISFRTFSIRLTKPLGVFSLKSSTNIPVGGKSKRKFWSSTTISKTMLTTALTPSTLKIASFSIFLGTVY